MLNAESLRRWCGRLGLPEWGSVDELRSRVERSLAVQHMDAYLLDCEDCGFSAPDVEEVDSCPGCGADFADPEEEQLQTANNVTPLSAKTKKQQEDRELREFQGKAAEREAIQKLEAIEGKIDELRADAGCIEWDIGKHLREIYDRDLWQAGGKYKSFKDYVQQRFEFTQQTARAFMRISEHFTRDEAQGIPLGHLRLLANIPDDDARQEMVDLVKEKGDDMTFRDLAAQVKAKRAELGLNTERAGMEDTVLLNVRLKPGVVAEGEWKTAKRKNAKRTATFELGDNKIDLEDHGDEGFVVKLRKPNRE